MYLDGSNSIVDLRKSLSSANENLTRFNRRDYTSKIIQLDQSVRRALQIDSSSASMKKLNKSIDVTVVVGALLKSSLEPLKNWPRLGSFHMPQ